MVNSDVTALVVDDEPNNIRALKYDLEDDGYAVLTAKDGVEALEVLDKNIDSIKVVLLDRMMPNMDGIEFTKTIKSAPNMLHLPIIMQTAAAEKSQVIEGIQAGVYYYLTKPYDKKVMLSVVKAAVNDYGKYSQLRKELKIYKSKLRLVRDSHFEVQTMEDAHYLSTFVSQFFPNPERVVLGISELLVNAIEHGNLGITYEEKTALNSSGKLHDEIVHRQSLPENANKKVLMEYIRGEEEITLTIKDEGKGFKWQNFIDISPERATDNHGRGIALSRMISFDHMEYLGNGNEVMCKVRNEII